MPAILPLPSTPWQVTGNHWLCLPCIHPVDASIHVAGVVHAGTRSAIEFAGSENYLGGNGAPFAAIGVTVNGETQQLGADGMVWERDHSCLPNFSCMIGELAFRGTIFAPTGEPDNLAAAV